MFRLNKKSKIISKILLFFATICLVFISCFGFFAKTVKAAGILTIDIPQTVLKTVGNAWDVSEFSLDWIFKYVKEEVFNAALGVALNTIAYDAATYIGSGGEGGKAFWRKENLGDYMKNIGDNAAGVFIEKFAKDAWGEEWDICEPDFDLKMRIGIDLVKQERPKPNCSFTEMKKNWESELKSENFLTDFSNIFYTNDFPGYKVIKINSELNRQKISETNIGQMEDLVNNSWQAFSGPSKEATQPPGYFSEKIYGALESSRNLITKAPGGEPLVDAINVFINQLAYTLFQRLVGNLGKNMPYSSSSYSGDYGGLKDYESDPGGVAPSRENVKRKTMTIMSPNFSVKGDYNVLTELSMCPDSKNVETNHCVIGNSFRQAIEEKRTVIEAIDGGYINGDGIFGYKADGLEPDYKEAFPHRSILILKKYRIVPVGWDLAAQYIKDNLHGNSVSLKDLVDCYSETDEWEGTLSDVWCRGLVDPRWVLKAPLNYCKREGFGPNFLMEDVYGKGENSEIKVTRKKYCSDEQTCIQETDEGKCEYYGYCLEDYRKWNFSGESCDPTFNTCQTFKSSQGKKISYLKNTLDYASCGANSVGCAEYASEPTSNNIASGTVDWFSAASSMYFNRNVKECSEDKEGCHEFIRMGDKSGSNFIYDSSFEEGTSDFAGGTQSTNESYVGVSSMEFNANISASIEIGPGGYDVGGQIYSFSLFAKCPSGGSFRISGPGGGQASTTEIFDTDTWGRYGTTYGFPSGATGNSVNIEINSSGGTCYVDGVKLEKGREITSYSDYGEDNTIYQKLLPAYLEDDCYVSPGSDNRFDPNADSKCFEYGRKCNEDEVGCRMYDEQGSNFSVPAKVTAQDYCPEECVGFDTYFEKETYFADREENYLIPETGNSCNAEFAGCDEFTNLDKLEEGGEAREYYVELRQCVSDTSPNCAPFYTWQTDENQGQQLVSYTLQADGSGNPYDIGGGACSLAEMDPSNPSIYNPDCREFYNRDGNVSYVLFTHTVSCSADCHAYRRTKKNVISGVCPGPATSCGVDSITSELIYCKNNGEWSTEHNACIYHGIPGQGKACSANNNGCREYNGNQGNNERVVLLDSFEAGVEDWSSGAVSSESLRTDQQSLSVSGSTQKTVGTYVHEGSAYVIEFLAKGSGPLNISLGNSSALSSFEPVTINNEWGFYRVNLEDLDHTPTSTEFLEISGVNFYIDNIKLTEITDRYYLIEDSWNTPDSCNEDIYGTPAPGYMLGCSIYKDGDGDTNYLHEFSSLCQESAVGCEIMIDKHNYEERAGFSSATTPSVVVPADSFDYIAYSKENKCNAKSLGCERFGERIEYNGTSVYHDTYLNNNPNLYNEILCNQDDVGCEAWDNGEGEEYFRDPGDEVCLWQQEEGQIKNGGWGWYRKQVKRCDTDSDGTTTISDTFCVNDSDCDLASTTPISCSGDNDCNPNDTCSDGYCHYSCILESSVNPCSTDIGSSSIPKTLGKGGLGNYVEQPAGYLDGGIWVGICPASESGCTEYIDPTTKFNPNLFDDRYTSPEAQLEPYTLYYDPANNILSSSITDYININGNPNIFYIYSSSTNPADLRVVGSQSDVLRELRVDYQIKSELNINEKGLGASECNGIYSPDEGCVLFYERDVDRDGYSGFKFNSVDSNPFEAPNTSNPPLDSNRLLKVSPDRDCDSWLACETYTKQEDGTNECFDVGVCASLGENGNCDYFVTNTATDTENNQNLDGTSTTKASISNLTGYSMVGYSYNSSYFKVPYDLYNPGYMTQIGQKTEVPNGSFEMYNEDTMYPYGWRSAPVAGGGAPSWDENLFSVIDNPIDAQKENITHPYFGKSFLRFSPAAGMIESDFIEVEPGGTYVLSFWINTQNMQTSGGFDNMRAGISVETYDGEGSITTPTAGGNWGADFDEPNCPDCDYAPQPTRNGLNNMVEQGNDWVKKVVKFKLGDKTRRLKLFSIGTLSWGGAIDCFDGAGSLFRCLNTIGCGDTRTSIPDTCQDRYTSMGGFCNRPGPPATANKTISSCGGTVYFDNIQLSPALEIKEYNDGTKWEQSQSCRLYPREDSLACEYFGDSGQKYKGQKGYCLQYDRAPGNPNACLVWWPVDRIRGAAIKEGGIYNDKYPLYYCVKTGTTTVPITSKVQMGQFGEDGGLVSEVTGPGEGSGSFDSGDIKDKYRGMFRYPYVQSFKFISSESDSEYPMPTFIMKKDSVELVKDYHGRYQPAAGWSYDFNSVDEDEWGGWAYVGNGGHCWNYNYLTTGGTPICGFVPWHDYDPNLSDTCGDDNNRVGLKIVTDSDPDYANTEGFDDPYPGVRGDILGFIWKICDGDNGGYMLAKFDNDVGVTYCDKLVRTVTSIGENKYWSGKVFKGSPYIVKGVTDYDPNLGVWNDIGFSSFSTPFGSILADNPQEDPNMWVKTGEGLYEPLYYSPLTSETNEKGNEYANYNIGNYPSAGKPYDLVSTTTYPGLYSEGEDRAKSILKSLFAQSYGFWEWQERFVCSDGKTDPDGGLIAGTPGYSFKCNDCGGQNCITKAVTSYHCFSGVSDTGNVCVDENTNGPDSSVCAIGETCGPVSVNINVCENDTSEFCDPTVFCGNGLECTSDSRYEYVEGGGWSPPVQPGDACPGGERPTSSPEDQCGIPPNLYLNNDPSLNSIRVNGNSVLTTIYKAGFVHLTFNSHVDSQQLPLTMYKIDWGDGSELSETGIKMMHKPNASDPHSFYHLYSYWDLLAKSISNPIINCSNPNCCVVRPQIRIKDNWNWYFPSATAWYSGPQVEVCK